MVVTLGFKDTPNLDVLEEARWELVIALDEDQALNETYLVAHSLDEWTTVLHPPSPFADDLLNLPTTWQLLQWHKDAAGNDLERTAVPITVTRILDLAPLRFQDWVMSTTTEAIDALEALIPELGADGPGLGFDNGATMISGIETLRDELAAGQERRTDLRRRREQLYGTYLYDFPRDIDRRWEVGPTADGTEALIILPANASDGSFLRAMVPPDELTPWRWTDPGRPEAGGEYLTPAEVLSRVPPALHGWVAAKTHEALQHARHALYELGSRTLTDAEDFARMTRIAKHAHGLAGFSRGSGIAPSEEFTLEDEDLVDAAPNPDGRLVLLLTDTWQHVLAGHPEMEEHVEAMIATIEEPEHREPDVRAGRERYFRRCGPESWLRVVVELAGPVDRVVTAFPQANPPEHWRPR